MERSIGPAKAFLDHVFEVDALVAIFGVHQVRQFDGVESAKNTNFSKNYRIEWQTERENVPTL